jgi:hypothetical protein
MLGLVLPAGDTRHGFFPSSSSRPTAAFDHGAPTTVLVRTGPRYYRVPVRLASARVIEGSIVSRARFPRGIPTVPGVSFVRH